MQQRSHAPVEAPTGRMQKTITIRPDAKTGNQSWPCRELSLQAYAQSQALSLTLR
jgi:hypothetical protein